MSFGGPCGGLYTASVQSVVCNSAICSFQWVNYAILIILTDFKEEMISNIKHWISVTNRTVRLGGGGGVVGADG